MPKITINSWKKVLISTTNFTKLMCSKLKFRTHYQNTLGRDRFITLK